jgi:hypothetical protein
VPNLNQAANDAIFGDDPRKNTPVLSRAAARPEHLSQDLHKQIAFYWECN